MVKSQAIDCSSKNQVVELVNNDIEIVIIMFK